MRIEQYKHFVTLIKQELSKILLEKCFSDFIILNNNDEANHKGQVFTFEIFYSTEYQGQQDKNFIYEPIVRPILQFQFKGKYKNETFDINQFFHINDLLFEEIYAIVRRGALDSLIPILSEANNIPEFKEIYGSFFIALESSVKGTSQFINDLLEESILTIGLSENNEIEFDCSQNAREKVTTTIFGGIPTIVNVPFDKKMLFNTGEIELVREVEKLYSNEIFIIHGHDNEMKKEVQLFLNHAGLTDVVLHECPDRGRTIIEKLIDESSSASYVIALLSPDDILENGQLRARQNVILEIGYFLGKLGRDKVRLLKKGSLEVPSDLQGILYDNFDSTGGWKIRLLKELKAIGMSVDIDRVISKF